jgi:hypothetical protein
MWVNNCKLWLAWNLEVINIYLLCCNWISLHMSRQSAVDIVNGMRTRRTRKQGSIPVTQYGLPACPLLPDRLWNKHNVGKGSEGKEDVCKILIGKSDGKDQRSIISNAFSYQLPSRRSTAKYQFSRKALRLGFSLLILIIKPTRCTNSSNLF